MWVPWRRFWDIPRRRGRAGRRRRKAAKGEKVMGPFFRARDFQPDPEKDISEEIQAHLELKAEELLAGGLSREEALAEARRRLMRPGTPGAGSAATGSPAERRRWPRTCAMPSALSGGVRESPCSPS